MRRCSRRAGRLRPGDVQIRRMRERNGLDDTAALQRLAAQLPIDEKRDRATWIIDNSGGSVATEQAVAAWWNSVVTQ